MEIANAWEAEGEPLGESGGEHKVLLRSGDRVSCLYYKLPPSPDKDVMEGAHAHQSESVWYIIEGELEINVDGEPATLKKGDVMLRRFNAVLGNKVTSKVPAEVLIIASPNNVRST